MKSAKSSKELKVDFRLVLLLILIASSSLFVYEGVLGQPTGAEIFYNVTTTAPAAPAGSLVTAGGTFTTLVLNGTFQTQKWKAYVGNVTGIIVLSDSNQFTIYNWDLVSISGEVYVSRNDSVSWSSVTCALQSDIYAEENYLNINSSSADSINKTFNQSIHKAFYVGTILIQNSTCRSIATFVNDTRQAPSEDADFQMIMLKDSSDLVVYASILEDKSLGYNLNPFDFQLIVPEDETKIEPTPYYFYVEIS